jgi:8-oxo-dGTP pyrophosphatase MutT (NUDIX family)
MNKNTTICNNCGKQSHMFYQCKLPITSYGIIVFRYSDQGIQFLMIRRKDSFGYIDFVRGKYSPHNLTQLNIIIDEMSLDEKNRILTLPFEKLWTEMWCESNIQYNSEEFSSKKKFESLKEGILMNNKLITLKDIVEMSKTKWKETEWEFPKGRRNQKEKDLECALREFEEETGIFKTEITIIENVLPFEEMFIGSNHRSYKHKYFLALMEKMNDTEDQNYLNNFQKTEVSKLEWKTIDNCLESIRPYNLEKKELIENINKVLQEYRLYS